MRIRIERPFPDQLVFRLVPDEHDAFPPVDSVFIKHPGVGKIDDARMALIAYFLASEFTCNVLALEGMYWPAYLAAKVSSTTPSHEIFPAPVSNTPQKILPELTHACLYGTSVKEGGELSMTRYELGREIHGLSIGSLPAPLRVLTNVDLIASFLTSPNVLADIIIYLSLVDAYGIESLVVATTEEAQIASIGDLVAAVGGRVEVARGVR